MTVKYQVQIIMSQYMALIATYSLCVVETDKSFTYYNDFQFVMRFIYTLLLRDPICSDGRTTKQTRLYRLFS